MAIPSIAVNTIAGAKVVSSADLSTMTTYVLLEQQDWFEHEMTFVRAFALPGMHALDIGANHGVYALCFAASLHGQGHVWAFEPTAAPFSMLARSVTVNHYQQVLTVLNYGLSDQRRDAVMYVSANSELNTLHGQTGQTEQVHLQTLDEVLPQLTHGMPIDFVKLDAEGEELNIIKGGRRFFAEQSPLVMFEIRHGSELNHGLWDAFIAMGYQLYRHLPGPNLLVTVDVHQPFEPYALNLFAAKPDRQQQLMQRGLLVNKTMRLPVDVSLPRWQAAFEAFPYAAAFLPNWRRELTEAATLHTQHEQALNCYLSAQSARTDAALRLALLQNAMEAWRGLRAAAPEQLSIGLCLARVTFDLGLRAEALQGLTTTMHAMHAATGNAFSLPFLPPVSSFDHVEPRGSVPDWLSAALLAAYEQGRTFSSFFSGDSSMILQPHLANPNLPPELRRRYLLHARRTGKPVFIADNDTLLQPGANNLNPEVWRQFIRAQ